jgi:hypothetical protein
MEINKRYKFKDEITSSFTGIRIFNGREFILTGIGRINVHVQVIGRTQINTFNKLCWDELVEGEVKQTVIGQSKLEFKFI